MTGKKIEFDVEPNDTIDSIKTRLWDVEGIPKDLQRLFHAGKSLEDARDLGAYHIQPHAILHLKTQISTTPNDLVFPDRDAKKANIQAWKVRAKQGHFDDDICILDLQAHYNELSCLETDVVEASEFFHGNGTYIDAFTDRLQVLIVRHEGLLLVPDWMWQLLKASLADDFEASWKPVQEPLTSLWTTYLIFCRVLASFDALSQAGFCTSYYSILLEHPGKEIAEIVQIRRDVLGNIMTGVETATAQICNGSIHADFLHDHLRACVEETCSQLLDTFHFRLINFSDLPRQAWLFVGRCLWWQTWALCPMLARMPPGSILIIFIERFRVSRSIMAMLTRYILTVD